HPLRDRHPSAGLRHRRGPLRAGHRAQAPPLGGGQTGRHRVRAAARAGALRRSDRVSAASGPAAPPPHGGQPVLTRGAPLEAAKAALILVHGRNAAPANILTIADALANDQVAYLAPAAHGNTWYPYSFLAETQMNE